MVHRKTRSGKLAHTRVLAGGLAVLVLAGCEDPTDGEIAGETVAPIDRPQAIVAGVVQAQDPYFKAAADALALRIEQTQDATRAEVPAKNVILFVGDGMGVATITAARIHAGQMLGVDGESHQLAMDTFPHTALSRTYSHDFQIADSAATATAMVTGIKTRSGMLSVTAGVQRGDCASALNSKATTLLELAETAGLSTGVVSTAEITHATPAAGYAHAPERGWSRDTALAPAAVEQGCIDIAAQLLAWPYGDGLDVALGGGRGNFLPSDAVDPEYPDMTGWRGDGRNLLDEWAAKSDAHQFVWNAEQFASVDFTSDVKVLGVFEPAHLQFEADRAGAQSPSEPSLAELTHAAITRLSQNDKGYVLVVEGGRIDHAHHGGNAARALKDTVELDAAIAMALDMTDRADTLIVVTADHSHTLSIAGYSARNEPILGLSRAPDGTLNTGFDGKPYTTLGYINGPGSVFVGDYDPADGRPAPTEDEVLDLDYKQQSLVPMRSESHAGEDVIVYAWGPYDALFSGTVEQNYIFHAMAYASDMGVKSGVTSGE